MKKEARKLTRFVKAKQKLWHNGFRNIDTRGKLLPARDRKKIDETKKEP